jgi:hypothetical protein
MQGKTYSDAEKLRIQREFAKAADRSGRVMPIVNVAAIVAVAIGFAALFILPANLRLAVGIGFGILVAVILFLVPRLFPGIVCPGCKGDIELAWGVHCPECSAPGLRVIDPHYHAECSSCGGVLRYSGKTGAGRTRSHKIRACTRCGVQFGGRYI